MECPTYWMTLNLGRKAAPRDTALKEVDKYIERGVL